MAARIQQYQLSMLCFALLTQLSLVIAIPVLSSGLPNRYSFEHHDETRNIRIQTGGNDSVVSVLVDLTVPRENDFVSLMGNVVQMLSSMIQAQENNNQQLENIVEELDMELRPSTTPEPVITTTQMPMEDCSLAWYNGQFIITPLGGTEPFPVICDSTTASGGWIVIQRRFDGSVDFDGNWVDYENGFGSLDGEFWLGLSKLHTITKRGTWKVRFDLEDFDGNHAYAEYRNFYVGTPGSKYELSIRLYESGTAGDAMILGHSLHRMRFSTKDRDNDESNTRDCAEVHKSGFWFSNCALANINGQYLGAGVTNSAGMSWWSWKDSWAVLKTTEMKIKRID